LSTKQTSNDNAITAARLQAGAIDMHAHAFPDDLAERAITTLEAECPWQAVGGGTVANLLASMDAAGLAASTIFTIATRPDQAEGILRWCETIRSDRIWPFPSVHPDAPDATGLIERIARAGFAGIKLHPMYQNFAIDEPRMNPLYAACRDAGLVVTFHSGRDIAYPPDDDRASPQRLAKMLDHMPGLRVISSHMGGWRSWDAVEKHILGRDGLWIDTSFSLEELGPDLAAGMIRRHGPDRVVFGTDWPWRSHAESLTRLHNLGLSPAEEQAVRRDNAAKLLAQNPNN